MSLLNKCTQLSCCFQPLLPHHATGNTMSCTNAQKLMVCHAPATLNLGMGPSILAQPLLAHTPPLAIGMACPRQHTAKTLSFHQNTSTALSIKSRFPGLNVHMQMVHSLLRTAPCACAPGTVAAAGAVGPNSARALSSNRAVRESTSSRTPCTSAMPDWACASTGAEAADPSISCSAAAPRRGLAQAGSKCSGRRGSHVLPAAATWPACCKFSEGTTTSRTASTGTLHALASRSAADSTWSGAVPGTHSSTGCSRTLMEAARAATAANARLLIRDRERWSSAEATTIRASHATCSPVTAAGGARAAARSDD
mmetsp:Transcript_18531/g.46941  ORF Transcript_18531/g.46941 Transcript_18531/m.46941 type:complete len:311 (-) Transcript_18531:185-1117(-)